MAANADVAAMRTSANGSLVSAMRGTTSRFAYGTSCRPKLETNVLSAATPPDRAVSGAPPRSSGSTWLRQHRNILGCQVWAVLRHSMRANAAIVIFRSACFDVQLQLA